MPRRSTKCEGGLYTEFINFFKLRHGRPAFNSSPQAAGYGWRAGSEFHFATALCRARSFSSSNPA
jgi:hypothetical protein